jgi:hypothetical protein
LLVRHDIPIEGVGQVTKVLVTGEGTTPDRLVEVGAITSGEEGSILLVDAVVEGKGRAGTSGPFGGVLSRQREDSRKLSLRTGPWEPLGARARAAFLYT